MTDILWQANDMLLAAIALVLALGTVLCASLQRCIILFMVLGLVVGLIWARLKAPDLALAEVAIGSGIAGALLLAALRDTPPAQQNERLVPRQKLLLLTASAATVIAFSWILWPLIATEPATASARFDQLLVSSGVANPVTAILLNIRAYDTLLELFVLLTAALGILSLRSGRPVCLRCGPVLGSLLSYLVPLLVMMAGYLLWRGADAPGGAFQAGAVLAAAGILLHLAGYHSVLAPLLARRTNLLALGCSLFILAGLIGIAGQGFLYYRNALASWLILVIEAAAMLSIATILLLAFIGQPPSSSACVAPPADKDTS